MATLDELIKAAKELGIDFVACEMAMHILGIKKDDLDGHVQNVAGVATFLDAAKDGHIIFI